MVVTRNMSKKKVHNAKKKKKENQIRDCVIKIVRLTKEEVQQMMQSYEPVAVKGTKIRAKNSEIEAPSPQNKSSAKVSMSQKYNLRQKSVKSPLIKPTGLAANTKSKRIVTVKTTCPTKLWKTLKESRLQIPPKDSIVIAKMKGFSPWPAKLVGKRNKRALVYFFGTSNHGEVNEDEIIRFEDGLLLIKSLALKRIKDFHKAVREAEIFLCIPAEKSILHDILSM